MGFLNDLTPGLDWTNEESVSSNPNKVADGPHNAFVYDAKVLDLTAKGKGKSLVITYKMTPKDKEPGKQIDEWRRLPVVTADGKFATDKDETNASWLKRRMISLGVPESKLNDVDPGDLVGTEVIVTFKTNGAFQNVVDCKVAVDGNVVEGTAPSQAQGSLQDIM